MARLRPSSPFSGESTNPQKQSLERLADQGRRNLQH